MAYNSTVLGIGLTLDTQGYSRELKATGKETGKILSSLEAQAQNFSDRWSDITRNLRSVKSVASSMALYSTFQGIANAVSTASAELLSFSMHMENATVSMQYFVEGSDKAAKSLAYLREMQALAAETSFTTESAINLSQFMSAMGINLKATKSVMKVINDAAAATGASEANMSRIVTALGQILTKGRLAAEEIRQLANANIPIYDILQEQMGLTGDQIKNIGRYWIDANESVVAILTGLQTRYEGAADKIADTMSGMSNSIYDNSLMIGKVAASGVYEKLEEKVRIARDALSKYRDIAVNEGSTALFRTLLLDADASGKAGTQLLTLVGNARNLISTYGSLYNTIKPLISMFGQGLYYSVNTLITGFTALGKVVEATDNILSRFGVSLEDVFVVASQVYITYKVAKTFGYVGQAAASAAVHIYHLGTGFKTLLPATLTANTGIGIATVSLLGLGAVALYASGALDGLFNSFAKLDASNEGLPSDFERQFEEYRKAMETYNNSIKQYEGTFDESFESIAAAGANTFAVLTRKSTKAAKQSADRWLASFDEVYKVPDITEDIDDEDLNFADLASLIKELQYVFPAKITAELLEPDFDWSSVFTDDVAEGVGAAFEKFLPLGVAAMSLGLAQAFKKRFQEEQAKANKATGKATVETPEQKVEAQKIKLDDDITRSMDAATAAIKRSGDDALQQLKDIRTTLNNLNTKSIKLLGSTDAEIVKLLPQIDARIKELSFEKAINTNFEKIQNILASTTLDEVEKVRLLSKATDNIQNQFLPLSATEIERILQKQVIDTTVPNGSTLITQGELFDIAIQKAGKDTIARMDRISQELMDISAGVKYNSIVYASSNTLLAERIKNTLREYNSVQRKIKDTAFAFSATAELQAAYLKDLYTLITKPEGVLDFDKKLATITSNVLGTVPTAIEKTFATNADKAANAFNQSVTNALSLSINKAQLPYVQQVATAIRALETGDKATLSKYITLSDMLVEQTRGKAAVLDNEYKKALRNIIVQNTVAVSRAPSEIQQELLSKNLRLVFEDFGIEQADIDVYLPQVVNEMLTTVEKGASARISDTLLNKLLDVSVYQQQRTEIFDTLEDILGNLDKPKYAGSVKVDEFIDTLDTLFLPISRQETNTDIVRRLAYSNLNMPQSIITADIYTAESNQLYSSLLRNQDISKSAEIFETIEDNLGPNGRWTRYFKTLPDASTEIKTAYEILADQIIELIEKQVDFFKVESLDAFLHNLDVALGRLAVPLKRLPKESAILVSDAITNTSIEAAKLLEGEVIRYDDFATLIHNYISPERTASLEVLNETTTANDVATTYKYLDSAIQEQSKTFKAILSNDKEYLEFRRYVAALDKLYIAEKDSASALVDAATKIETFTNDAKQIIAQAQSAAVQKELTRYLTDEIIPMRFTEAGDFAPINEASLKTGKSAAYRQFINDVLDEYAGAVTNMQAADEAKSYLKTLKQIAKDISNQYDTLSIIQRVVTDGGNELPNLAKDATVMKLYPRIKGNLAYEFAENFNELRLLGDISKVDLLDRQFTTRYSHLYDIMSQELRRPSTAYIADEVIVEARRSTVMPAQMALTQLKGQDPEFFKAAREIFKDTKLFAAGGVLGAFASDTGTDRFGKSVMEHVYSALTTDKAYELGVIPDNFGMRQVFGFQRGKYLEQWVGNFLLPGHFNGQIRAGKTWYDPTIQAVSQMDLAGKLPDGVTIPIEVKSSSLGAHVDEFDAAVRTMIGDVNTWRTVTVSGKQLNTQYIEIPESLSETFYKALKKYDSSAAIQIAHLANISGQNKIALALIDANNNLLKQRLDAIYDTVISDWQIRSDIAKYGANSTVVNERIMRIIEEKLANFDASISKATRTIIFTVPEIAREEAATARQSYNTLIRSIVERYRAGVDLSDILQQVATGGTPIGIGFHAEQLSALAENIPLLPKNYSSIQKVLGNIIGNLQKQTTIGITTAEADIAKLSGIISDTNLLLKAIKDSPVIDGMRKVTLLPGVTISVPNEKGFTEFLGEGGVRDQIQVFLSSLDTYTVMYLHTLDYTLSQMVDELKEFLTADNAAEVLDYNRLITQTQRILGNLGLLKGDPDVVKLLDTLDAIKSDGISQQLITNLEAAIAKVRPKLQLATPETIISRIQGLEPRAIEEIVSEIVPIETVSDTLVREVDAAIETINATVAEAVADTKVLPIADEITEVRKGLNFEDLLFDDVNDTSVIDRLKAYSTGSTYSDIELTRILSGKTDITDNTIFKGIATDFADAMREYGLEPIEQSAVNRRWNAVSQSFYNTRDMIGNDLGAYYRATSFLRDFSENKQLTKVFEDILTELYSDTGRLIPDVSTAASDALISYVMRANQGLLGASDASISTARKSLSAALKNVLGVEGVAAGANISNIFDAFAQSSKTVNKASFDSLVKGYRSLGKIEPDDFIDFVDFLKQYKELQHATEAATTFTARAMTEGFAKNFDDALKKLGKASNIDVSVLRNFNAVNLERLAEVLADGLEGDAREATLTAITQLTKALNDKRFLKGALSKLATGASEALRIALQDIPGLPGIGIFDIASYIIEFINTYQRTKQYKQQYNDAVDNFLAATLDLSGLDIDDIKIAANVNKAIDDFWNSYGNTVTYVLSDAAVTMVGTMLGSMAQAFITGATVTIGSGPGAMIGGLVAALGSAVVSIFAGNAGVNSFYNQYADDIKKQINSNELYDNLIAEGYTHKDATAIAAQLNRFNAFTIAESVYDSEIARGEAGFFNLFGKQEAKEFLNDLYSLSDKYKLTADNAATFSFSETAGEEIFRDVVNSVETYRSGEAEQWPDIYEMQRLYDEMEVFLLKNATGAADEGFTKDIVKLADSIALGSDLDYMRRALEGLNSGINLLSAATGQPINFYSADAATQVLYSEQLASIYEALTQQATHEAVAEQIQGILAGNAFTLDGDTATIFATLSTESAIVADGLSQLYDSLGLVALSADALETSLTTLGYSLPESTDLSNMVAFGTATQYALDTFRSNLAGWSVDLPEAIEIGSLSAEDVSILANAGVQITDAGAIFAQAQEAGEAGAERDFAYNIANVTAAEAERLAKDFKVSFDDAGNILLDTAAILANASQMSFMFDADVANLSTAANTLLAGYYEEVDTQGNVQGRIPTGYEGLGEYNTENGTFTITNAEILAGGMTIEDWISNLNGTDYYRELFENAQGGATGLYTYLVGLSNDVANTAEKLGISYQEALAELAQGVTTIVDTNISEQYGQYTQKALTAAGIGIGEYGEQYGITYSYLGEGWESGQNRFLTSDYEKLSDAAKDALNTLSELYDLGIDIGNVYTTLDVSKTFNPEKMQYFYSILDEASLKSLPSYTLEWLKATEAIQQAEDGTYLWVQGMETASTGLVEMTGNLVGNYALLSDDLQHTLGDAAELALGSTDMLSQYMQTLENGYATVKFVSDEAELNMADTNQRISLSWEDLANSQNASLQQFEDDMLHAAAVQLGFTDTSEMDIEELRTKVNNSIKGISISADVETAFGDAAQLFDKYTGEMTSSAQTMATTIEQSFQRVVDSIDRLANIQLANNVSLLTDNRTGGNSAWLESKGNGTYRFFFGKEDNLGIGQGPQAYEISNASSIEAAARSLIAQLKTEGLSDTDISDKIIHSIARYGVDTDNTKQFIEAIYTALGMQIPSTLKQGFGFANGGIVATDGLYRIAEQNRKEAIIPLENPIVSGHIGAAIASMVLASDEFNSLASLQGIRNGGISTRIVDARSAAAVQQRSSEEVAATMADAVLQRILPTIVATNSTTESVDTRTPVYVGTLIADDTGLRELNKKMKVIEAKEARRV